MLLRYLSLPNYGVLKDVRIRFNRDPIFDKLPKLSREGALHFVVGLNGTGKSSLLRAINETFRWLSGASNEKSRPFPFPVSMVYDAVNHSTAEAPRTCFFHHPGHSISGGIFFIAESIVDEDEHGDWDDWFKWLTNTENLESVIQHGVLLDTSALQGDYRITATLPDPLLAYTSGALAPWTKVSASELPEQDLVVITADQLIDERPRGWDVHRELSTSEVELDSSQRDELRRLADPNNSILGSRCRLLTPLDLKFAAITIGLCVASAEFQDIQERTKREQWRLRLLADIAESQRGNRPKKKSARVLLNEVDWWFPSHLSITYRQQTYMLDSEVHAELLVLCVLAKEVVQQPLHRVQLVIDLGPQRIDLEQEIREIYADREIPFEVREVIKRVAGATSGAEAVLRILCTAPPSQYESNVEPRFARWPVFDRLHSLRTAGIIDDVDVTIKRVTQVQASDGELDDALVNWDNLSDGEQMLLCRMSLLLLLSEQHGSLLLLDEPETHFNDSWKREIIDFVDDNILKTTKSHVLVATHTSIALTDAFASEIIRLIRSEGKSQLKPVSFSTFGADVGRVMLHVFDTPESIGSRADDVLDTLLNYQWTNENIAVLEHVVRVVGGGWPRAKLREILEELRASPNS